ncbi:MAG TPA: M81 family metallopeptidase [Geminicoccaceae bacterium]|nr:M81 family metallopeptidase [Geminicoccaceae bacterium]
MARIAIGGLHHETNSFSPQPASFARFAEADGWPPLSRGEALFANTAGINLAVTGFSEAARARGHALVPLVWANACPSGPVTEDAFERIAAMLLEDLALALPVDGVFLDLHGAMVTDHLPDGEGELLRRVRTLVGATPVVVALDLHANVSALMVEAADVLVAYRTYPHVDLAETGARCLPLLERRMDGGAIMKGFAKPDYLVPLPWQCTTIEPGRSLYGLIPELEAEGALSASICMGFPAADTPVLGPALLAYAAESESAERAVARLAEAYRAAEPSFGGRLWQPDEAVAHALARGGPPPVLLADTQDNPGGGGTSDTTVLLRALIRAQAEGAVLAVLTDAAAADAAHGAGEGALLAGLPLGGRHGPKGVRPVVEDWRVRRLGDGRFTATGPMYRGNRIELGPMALLSPASAPGVAVIVASRRLQAADRAIFRHLGVEPAAQRLLALKSSVHFRADFEPIAAEVLVVEAPGVNIADPRRLPFTRVPPSLRLAPGVPSPLRAGLTIRSADA